MIFYLFQKFYFTSSITCEITSPSYNCSIYMNTLNILLNCDDYQLINKFCQNDTCMKITFNIITIEELILILAINSFSNSNACLLNPYFNNLPS